MGKSNILARYAKNSFDPNPKATVGLEFSNKKIVLDKAKINV